MTDPERKPDLSVVVPILNERGTLVELTERIVAACSEIDRAVEVLLIDDGSSDGSWETIGVLARVHQEVRGIRQRRTFGKAAALSVGLERARGDVIVTMDGDLQDDPSELPRFLSAIGQDGVDAVSGWKRERHDPLGKRLPSKFFNLVLRRVSGLGLHDFNCGFKAYTRDAADAMAPYVYGEMHRYLPAVLGAQGFTVVEIDVRHHARVYGRSKYGLGRIFAGSFDLMTVLMLTKYRYRPMHAFGALAAIAAAGTVLCCTMLAALAAPLAGGLALGIGLLLVMTLLGAGVVSELAVHGMGSGQTGRRVSATAERAGSLDRVATPLAPTEAVALVGEVDRALERLAAGVPAPVPHTVLAETPERRSA